MKCDLSHIYITSIYQVLMKSSGVKILFVLSPQWVKKESG